MRPPRRTSFTVSKWKEKRNAKPKRGNKNTESRPRQSAKAATGACVGGCTKNSIVRGDAIDRSYDRSIVSVPAIFERFVIVERSIHVQSIIPLDSFECATYKVHVHFDSTRIIDGTAVLLNCVPCRKSRRHVDGSCQRMLLSYVRGFPFNYD